MGDRARDGGYSIRLAMAKDLMADFDFSKVDGLDSNPVITLTVTPRTPEPYVYFYETESDEEWVTKTSESRKYNIVAQVVVKNNVGRGTTKQRDQITNQVLEHITDQTDFPIPQDTGYIIQRITTGSIVKNESVERGARYFIANIPIEVTAYYAGFNTETQPVAIQSLSYAGFEFEPSSNNIETWDSGSVTAANTYGDSNGWTLDSLTVSKTSGKNDGTLVGNTLSIVDSDTSLGLTSTLSWEAVSDASETTSTTISTTINRIKSLRFGSITSALQPSFSQADLQALADWNTGNRVLDYGTVSVIGKEITIDTNAGDWLYIVMDAADPVLTEVRESVLNQDILSDVFEAPVVTGGYRIYVAKTASSFDNTSFTYTLN